MTGNENINDIEFFMIYKNKGLGVGNTLYLGKLISELLSKITLR